MKSILQTILNKGFSAKYETEFTPLVSEELVFKCGATGFFELLVNDESIKKYQNWRTLPSRIPFKVEAGKKYKIEILFAQLNNWQANIEFDFGKEVDVDYTNLIKKLKGIDLVVFVGGLSSKLEGKEMPVSYPGFKRGDRTDIELPSSTFEFYDWSQRKITITAGEYEVYYGNSSDNKVLKMAKVTIQ